MVFKVSLLCALLVLVAYSSAYDYSNCPSNTNRQKILTYNAVLPSGYNVRARLPATGYYSRPITCLLLIDQKGSTSTPKISEGGYLDTYALVNITSNTADPVTYYALVFID
ncbi:uncharacterized protein LOC114325694 [Diabrotica virgifera virgifera]|uniref:CUB domain-containing protein n=1 Tax=Diabrotica virgifera virgifera TaxID=50390 RepID=A0ABM5KQ36_DIAVI|nr:uncharacterized protein LOC114325694 [Diabrotica virgifera virgifera]